jgi:hypothetical protein
MGDLFVDRGAQVLPNEDHQPGNGYRGKHCRHRESGLRFGAATTRGT